MLLSVMFRHALRQRRRQSRKLYLMLFTAANLIKICQQHSKKSFLFSFCLSCFCPFGGTSLHACLVHGLQKATFQPPKGGLLHAKTRPFRA